METMGSLRKCPFCGGEAKQKQDTAILLGGLKELYWVECTKCGIRTPNCRNFPEAISKWQTGSEDKS